MSRYLANNICLCFYEEFKNDNKLKLYDVTSWTRGLWKLKQTTNYHPISSNCNFSLLTGYTILFSRNNHYFLQVKDNNNF